VRSLRQSEVVLASSAPSRTRIALFSFLPCLVASLLLGGCIIAPIPMTKRVSAAAGGPGQNKIDLTFVQAGQTLRSEVAQKLSWADSGIKEDHLFLARWASPGSGWVWLKWNDDRLNSPHAS